MGLQQFERRLERLVEGVFTKAFRSALQPVEIGRRLVRALDDGRTVGVNGVLAPNHLDVAVAPVDHERFVSFEDALIHELEDAVRAHAREEGYRFMGPVEIVIEPDGALREGECEVVAEIVAGAGGQAGSLVLADGRRITLGERPLSIGRLPDCDIPVPDAEVSRRHAEVRREPDGFRVVDLSSTNGTLVNGGPVREKRLDDGDEIRVGATTIRFEAV